MAQALRASTLRVVGGLDHRAEDAPERVLATTTLVIENMVCGGCMVTIERALCATPGVAEARANLSAKRVTVVSDAEAVDTQALIDALEGRVLRPPRRSTARRTSPTSAPTISCAAWVCAGFAAANVMLLSVSVWAGLASDMDIAAQGLFHWHRAHRHTRPSPMRRSPSSARRQQR